MKPCLLPRPSPEQAGHVSSWVCMCVLSTASAGELGTALWVLGTGQIYGAGRNI